MLYNERQRAVNTPPSPTQARNYGLDPRRSPPLVCVMVNIRQLFDLQQLDWEIASRAKSLEETRFRLNDVSAIEAVRRRQAQIGQRLDAARSERRKREAAVSGLEQRLENLDRRVYGGFVTNPRELEASEEERAFLQQQKSEEEDGLLEALVLSEDLEEGQSVAAERMAALESAREAERPVLLARESELSAELERLRRAREEAAPQLPAAALSTYESLLRSKNGHAVAQVERSVCQGCRMTLPSMEVQRARQSSRVALCSNCGRILYVV